jgi:hypothetical protein
MRPTILRAGVLVAAGLLLVGCTQTTNGSGSPLAAGSGPASGRGAAPGSGIASPTAAAADPTSSLLALSDLPTGWAIDNSDSGGDGDDSDEPSCLAGLDKSITAEGQAQIQFQFDGSIPELSQAIGTFGSSAAASTAFKAGSASLDSCTDLSFTTGGQTIQGTIAPLSFEKIGDQAKAWAMTFAANGISVGFDIVVFQKGSTLEELGLGDIGTPNLTDLTTYCDKALAKAP